MNDFLKGNIIRKDKSLPDTVIGRNIYMYVRFVDRVVGYLLAENNMSADGEYLCILPRDLYSVPTNTPVLARFIEKDGNRFIVEIKKEKEVTFNNCTTCKEFFNAKFHMGFNKFLGEIKILLDAGRFSQLNLDDNDSVDLRLLKTSPAGKIQIQESFFSMSFVCNECAAEYCAGGDVYRGGPSWGLSAYGSKHDI